VKAAALRRRAVRRAGAVPRSIAAARRAGAVPRSIAAVRRAMIGATRRAKIRALRLP